jgi:peptidoglycan-associated lipoprotein
MNFWNKTAIVVIPALLMLGCGTKGEVQEEGAAAGQPTTGAPAEGAATSGVGAGGAVSGEAMGEGAKGAPSAFTGDPLDDPNSLLAKRVVYFDFDKSDIKDEFRDTIAAHAAYLASHPNVTISLEGHCDERGTREYNIALGERRANAVQRMLTLQGVAASQINTISYGEERPAALGHDEDAWAMNRRAEFIYRR